MLNPRLERVQAICPISQVIRTIWRGIGESRLGRPRENRRAIYVLQEVGTLNGVYIFVVSVYKIGTAPPTRNRGGNVFIRATKQSITAWIIAGWDRRTEDRGNAQKPKTVRGPCGTRMAVLVFCPKLAHKLRQKDRSCALYRVYCKIAVNVK